jgi:hypothetical protein
MKTYISRIWKVVSIVLVLVTLSLVCGCKTTTTTTSEFFYTKKDDPTASRAVNSHTAKSWSWGRGESK